LKILLRAGAFLIFIFVITTVILTADILIGWRTFKPLKADCIIILGCKVNGTIPSPFLISRIDEGIRLYKLGYGKHIIMSGGKGPGENISEADAMKDYAISMRVPGDKIIIEAASTNTHSNLRNSKRIMDANNLKSAIIVSNKFHLKRASLIAKKLGIAGSYSGVFNPKYKTQEASGFLREILATYKFYLYNE
jgi:uncharacterized SAM-binding protein YcdF (DUF218 family)